MLTFIDLTLANTQKELNGTQIAQKVFDIENGTSSIARMKMSLVEKGKSKEREFISIGYDEKNRNNRNLIRFLKPKNIANTSLLTHDQGGSDNLQWLYLPAMKKVRKISASGKGRKFVGSDIYYEDMQSREVSKDNHKRLKDDKYEGTLCYVVESTPKKASSSSYTKKVAWIHPQTWLPVMVDFYRDGKKIKNTKVKNMKKIQDIWTITESLTEDLVSKHQTRIELEKIKYNIGVGKDFFTTKNLELAGSHQKYLKNVD